MMITLDKNPFLRGMVFLLFNLFILKSSATTIDSSKGILDQLSHVYSTAPSLDNKHTVLFLAIQYRTQNDVFIDRLKKELESKNYEWESTINALQLEYLKLLCDKSKGSTLKKERLDDVRSSFEKDLGLIPNHCVFISSEGMNPFARSKQLAAEVGCTVRHDLQSHDVDKLIFAVNKTWETQFYSICQSNKRESALSEQIQYEVNLNRLLEPEQFDTKECRENKRNCTKRKALALIKQLETANQHPAQHSWAITLKDYLGQLCSNRISCVLFNDSKYIANLTIAINVIESLDKMFLPIIDGKLKELEDSLNMIVKSHPEGSSILSTKKAKLEETLKVTETISNNLGCGVLSIAEESDNNTHTICFRLRNFKSNLAVTKEHINSLTISKPRTSVVDGCGQYLAKGEICP